MDKVLNFIPEKYRPLVPIAIAVAPYITRAAHALMNGRGIRGVLSAIWFGTNTPKTPAPVDAPAITESKTETPPLT